MLICLKLQTSYENRMKFNVIYCQCLCYGVDRLEISFYVQIIVKRWIQNLCMRCFCVNLTGQIFKAKKKFVSFSWFLLSLSVLRKKLLLFRKYKIYFAYNNKGIDTSHLKKCLPMSILFKLDKLLYFIDKECREITLTYIFYCYILINCRCITHAF